MRFTPASLLIAGDLLLYGPSSLFGWITCVKTWSKVCHCEIYAGGSTSYAAQPGNGVNAYALRLDDLVEVMRPPPTFDVQAAKLWFGTVRGQRYDYNGLLCFALAARRGDQDRMFCSEFATRFYRAGGFEPFQPDYDADHVAPGQFLASEPMKPVWKAA